VSELCQIPLEIPGKHRDLGGHSDAHRCCGKSHPSDDSRTIKSVLALLHLKDGMPSVLLHHSPAGAQYAAANGIDLMIAGHTHGGQFFPGTLVATAIFPSLAACITEALCRSLCRKGPGRSCLAFD